MRRYCCIMGVWGLCWGGGAATEDMDKQSKQKRLGYTSGHIALITY